VLELDSPTTAGAHFLSTYPLVPVLIVIDSTHGVLPNGVEILNQPAGTDPLIQSVGNANEGLQFGESTGSYWLRLGTNINGFLAGVTLLGSGVGGQQDELNVQSSAPGTIIIQPNGPEAAISINLKTKGAGTVQINGSPIVGVTWPLANAGDEGFQPNGVANNALDLHNAAASVNGVTISGAATTVAPTISATGTDGNIGLILAPKGSGQVVVNAGGIGVTGESLFTGDATNKVPVTIEGFSAGQTADLLDVLQTSGGTVVLAVQTANNAVNGLQISGAATTNPVTIVATGSDTNVGMSLRTKGTGSVFLRPGGNNGLTVAGVASAVNYVTITQSATTVAPSIAATGSDAAIDLTLSPKSTGLVNFGYAVTALGGGSAPTFGTIGGSGPATAGQNSWLAVKINGTASYIPVWR